VNLFNVVDDSRYTAVLFSAGFCFIFVLQVCWLLCSCLSDSMLGGLFVQVSGGFVFVNANPFF